MSNRCILSSPLFFCLLIFHLPEASFSGCRFFKLFFFIVSCFLTSRWQHCYKMTLYLIDPFIRMFVRFSLLLTNSFLSQSDGPFGRQQIVLVVVVMHHLLHSFNLMRVIKMQCLLAASLQLDFVFSVMRWSRPSRWHQITPLLFCFSPGSNVLLAPAEGRRPSASL